MYVWLLVKTDKRGIAELDYHEQHIRLEYYWDLISVLVPFKRSYLVVLES